MYAANYKHSFEDVHPLRVTMRWIYHGFPQKLFHNGFNLNMETAPRHPLSVQQTRVRHRKFSEDAELLKKHPIPEDAYVVRFNKAMRRNGMDLCVFNDVLYDKLYEGSKDCRSERS